MSQKPLNSLEWDKVPKSIYGDLIQNHEQLVKIQKDLTNKRAHTDKYHKVMNEKWDDIAQKKNNLKELLSSSGKIFIANQASTIRIMEKINDNKKQQESLDVQIDDLNNQKDNMINILKEMDKYVNKYAMFELFLEGVAGRETDFNSVNDILNRYECLENVREELQNNMKQSLEDIINARKEMITITEEKSSLFRKLENKMINMQVKIKEVKENSRRWEIIVQRVKLLIIKKREERKQFKAGCWDLYNSVFMRRQQSVDLGLDNKEFEHSQELHKISPKDTEGQLDYIQKSIQFYKEVLRIASTTKNV